MKTFLVTAAICLTLSETVFSAEEDPITPENHEGSEFNQDLDKSQSTANSRQSRLFPYFLIQFPNEPCTGSAGGGVCVAAKECRQQGGVNLGVCAQGFGVCCRYTKTCGLDGGDIVIKENSTDITRSVNGSSSCRFVLPKMRNICQVRLDFMEFDYGVASRSGNCNSAKLEMKGDGNAMDFCGNLTGQHLYLNYGNSDKLYIRQTDATSDLEDYSIRISYIKCNSRRSVPSHCAQYFTGTSGEIKSFNWPNQQLNNQDYTVCVANPFDSEHKRGRMFPPIPKIHWSACEVQNQSIARNFFISGRMEDPPVSDPMQCDTDFVQVFGGNRQCGNKFQTETISSLPYLLHVKFDGKEMDEIEKRSSTMNVSQPREGCASLNTKETKCLEVNPVDTKASNNSLIKGGLITEGGVCKCAIVPRENSKRFNADIKNTGFCLKFHISSP